MLRQFVTFCGVGVLGTATHYTALLLLRELGGLDAVLASTAGAILGGIVNYLLNYRYTFASTARHHQAAPKFFAVAAIGWGLNAVLMALFVHHLFVPYLIAQMITTGLLILFYFAANRAWTFRERLS